MSIIQILTVLKQSLSMRREISVTKVSRMMTGPEVSGCRYTTHHTQCLPCTVLGLSLSPLKTSLTGVMFWGRQGCWREATYMLQRTCPGRIVGDSAEMTSLCWSGGWGRAGWSSGSSWENSRRIILQQFVPCSMTSCMWTTGAMSGVMFRAGW